MAAPLSSNEIAARVTLAGHVTAITATARDVAGSLLRRQLLINICEDKKRCC